MAASYSKSKIYNIVIVILFKYLFTKFPLSSCRHSDSSSLPSTNGSSKSQSASKALRTSSTDKQSLLAILLVNLFC